MNYGDRVTISFNQGVDDVTGTFEEMERYNIRLKVDGVRESFNLNIVDSINPAPPLTMREQFNEIPDGVVFSVRHKFQGSGRNALEMMFKADGFVYMTDIDGKFMPVSANGQGWDDWEIVESRSIEPEW